MTTDARIHDIAVAYILKGVGGRTDWPYTVIGVLHPSLTDKLKLADGEMVLASACFSNESWYAFTARRIVSQFQGAFQSLDPSHGLEYDFGNFKGYGPSKGEDMLPDVGVIPREVATITATDSRAVVRFEFETWEASTIPTTAVQYWVVKHPFLHKLMSTAEREEYKSRNR